MVDVLDSSVSDVSINADASGSAITTWTQIDDEVEQVWAARFVPDAGWSEPLNVSLRSRGDVDNPSLALAPTGAALIAWEVDTEDGASEVWARALAP